MENILVDVDQHNESVKIMLTNTDNKDKLLKNELWFGFKQYLVNNFLDISSETLCPMCCYWVQLTINFPNVDKLRC